MIKELFFFLKIKFIVLLVQESMKRETSFFLDLVRFFKVDINMFRCKQYWIYCLRSLSEMKSTKFRSRLKDSFQNNLRPLESDIFPPKQYAPLFDRGVL